MAPAAVSGVRRTLCSITATWPATTVIRTKTGFIVGLAYNANANWALNILAADGGEISRGGRRYTLSQPRKRGAEARADLPEPIGFTMRKLGIDAFLEFDATRI
ncbi:hypothetical protein ABZV29_25550 [Streptomyces sp. NPDC005236]|uniref:hypothetical protein n=1 Tax=Streptomyces sp. NPDC005236 TaxID=3157028 RepID=UPI0033B795C1